MKSCILSSVIILLFIAACNGTFEVGLEHSPAGDLKTVSTPTLFTEPLDTLIPPTTTESLPYPATNVPNNTRVPTDTSSPHIVQIFMIAVDDNGKSGAPVGCGDSAVPVQVEIPSTQGVLKASLEALLSTKGQYFGQSGLYNALYQSDLQVDSISIDGNKASVYLTGTLLMGGECDTPRVQAQLEQTILQFSNITEVTIFINGMPLSDVLSLKGTVPQPSSTIQAPTQNTVKIFLIAVGDNGQTGTPVGCGDSVVPAEVVIQPTQGTLKPRWRYFFRPEINTTGNQACTMPCISRTCMWKMSASMAAKPTFT